MSLLCILLAGLLSETAVAESWRAVTTEAAFREQVVGRELTQRQAPHDTYLSHPDGRVTGSVAGKPYVGTWEWRDEAACFDGRAEGGPRVAACAQIENTGKTVKFAWKGWKTFTYAIGEK